MPYKAERIVIADTYSSDDSPLELCISNNDKIYINRRHHYVYPEAKTLTVSMSGGKIYLPRGKLFSISSENPIEGMVSSRGYIHSQQNIDIVVDNKDLNLYIIGHLAAAINNRRVSSADLLKYTNIKNFGTATLDFYDAYLSSLSKPIIEKDKKGTRANFFNARTDYIKIFEICDYADILYLHAEGILNIHNDAMVMIDKNTSSKDPDNMHRLYISRIHDDILNAVTMQDIPKAKKAFSEWESYLTHVKEEEKNKDVKEAVDGIKGDVTSKPIADETKES